MELEVGNDGKRRCFGNKPGQEYYAKYHDEEWGVPLHDDQKLFELLILEGAQAGLSWDTILKKRAGYKKVFHNFNIKKVASMTDQELEALRSDERIIRNRLKIRAARANARAALLIQKEFGSLDKYFWQFVNGKPIKNKPLGFAEVPVSTELSELISKDLKKRGMSFVGPTIIYSFMQAVGMVNDHVKGCFKY